MADLPASTAAVVDNNASSLGDLVQTTLTQLTIGVNLTPLSWILLAELLILGVVASIYAVRLVQRRRKELIDAISQMIEHYTRRMDGYGELQQKYLEEQFHLDPEKAALASNRMLQNQQAFLRSLTQALTNWDMQRLSRIHMEVEQLNHDQLTTIATSMGLAVPTEAKEEDDYFDEPEYQSPALPDEESDELLITETEPELEPEQEFEFTFEEETPQPLALDAEPEEEETLQFSLDEKEEEEIDLADDIEIPAPAPKPRHRNEEIDLLVPDNPEIIIDEAEALTLGISEEELKDFKELNMANDLGSLNHPNPIRKKKKAG